MRNSKTKALFPKRTIIGMLSTIVAILILYGIFRYDAFKIYVVNQVTEKISIRQEGNPVITKSSITEKVSSNKQARFERMRKETLDAWLAMQKIDELYRGDEHNSTLFAALAKEYTYINTNDVDPIFVNHINHVIGVSKKLAEVMGKYEMTSQYIVNANMKEWEKNQLLQQLYQKYDLANVMAYAEQVFAKDEAVAQKLSEKYEVPFIDRY